MRRILLVLGLAFLAVLLSSARQASSKSATAKPVYAQTATPFPAEALVYGNTVKHAFDADSGPYIFTFEAQVGDIITITMVADRGQTLDPALVLLGPDGSVVAQNDDSFDANFGPLNARLVSYPIPASGTYTIQATRSSDDGGNFTLSLRGNRSQSANAAAATAIDFGQSSQGAITDKTVRLSYQFRASQGDIVSIAVQTQADDTLIPFIVLLGPSGDKLTSSNPAERVSKTARITRYPIQAEGMYTIVVSRIGEEKGATSGNFKLVLAREATYPVMNYGDTLSGILDDQHYEATYLFTADAGDLVTVTMVRTSGDLDATLSILSASGRTLATNDQGSGEGLRDGDARITRLQLSTAGTYTIVASRKGRAKGTTSGDFSLTLDQDRVEPRSS